MVVGARVSVERWRDGEMVYSDASPRLVVHVQTNAFCLAEAVDTPRSKWSWCDWPKAAELSFPAKNEFAVSRKGGKLVFKLEAS